MTSPVRILPCLDAGPPALTEQESDYTNVVSASVKRLFDASVLELGSIVLDTAGDVAAGTTPALPALVPGMAFWYLHPADAPTNIGPFNVTIDTTAPAEARSVQGNALVGGEVQPNTLYMFKWDGTYYRIFSTDIAALVTGKAKPATIQQFDASGTWTKPTGYGATAMVYIRLWGGGGGGARWANSTAGGGSGGQFRDRWILLSQLGATETVTVGAGGAPRTGTDGVGSDGGNTSFGSWLTAFGGVGGIQAASVPAKDLWGVNLSLDANPILEFYGGNGGYISAPGRNSKKGGGGGGAGVVGAFSAPGTSEQGGAGGVGGASPGPGTQPSGGGGGSTGDGAVGGAGRAIIMVIDGT